MIYLALAIVTSTLILVTFKLLPRYDVHLPQAITINYLTAAILGYSSVAGEFHFSDIPAKPWFHYSLLVGLGLIMGFFVFGISTRKVGVTLTSVASKMSVVIPVVLGFWVFGDRIAITRVAGVVIALLAFYLSMYKEEKWTRNFSIYLWPLLLFMMNGLIDSLFKIAEAWYIGDEFVLFLATAFLASLFLGIVLSLLQGNRRQGLAVRHIIAGVVLGTLNWYSTYAVLKGLSVYDVSVFYPIYNVGVVGLSSLLGAWAFREKLSLINWVGVMLALTAILVIALN